MHRCSLSCIRKLLCFQAEAMMLVIRTLSGTAYLQGRQRMNTRTCVSPKPTRTIATLACKAIQIVSRVELHLFWQYKRLASSVETRQARRTPGWFVFMDIQRPLLGSQTCKRAPTRRAGDSVCCKRPTQTELQSGLCDLITLCFGQGGTSEGSARAAGRKPDLSAWPKT